MHLEEIRTGRVSATRELNTRIKYVDKWSGIMKRPQSLHFLYDGFHLQKAYSKKFEMPLVEDHVRVITNQVIRKVHELQADLYGGVRHVNIPDAQFISGKLPDQPPLNADPSKLAKLRQLAFVPRIEPKAGARYNIAFVSHDLNLVSPEQWQQDEIKSDGAMVDYLDNQVVTDDLSYCHL